MQKLVRLLLLLALVGFGFWGWRQFFPSPESRIRSQLSNLARTVSFDPLDGTVRRLYKLQHFADFFTPDVVVTVSMRGYEDMTLTGVAELQAAANRSMDPNGSRGWKVHLRDISVALDKDGQTAVANLTIEATIQGQQDLFAQEFNFHFRKVGRKWLIYRVESVQTLSGGPRSPCAPGARPS
jgi:hypothetical protein